MSTLQRCKTSTQCCIVLHIKFRMENPCPLHLFSITQKPIHPKSHTPNRHKSASITSCTTSCLTILPLPCSKPLPTLSLEERHLFANIVQKRSYSKPHHADLHYNHRVTSPHLLHTPPHRPQSAATPKHAANPLPRPALFTTFATPNSKPHTGLWLSTISGYHSSS